MIRSTFVFDEERIDAAVCREQAIKRARGDRYNDGVEATIIHFHKSEASCKDVMHEEVTPANNDDGHNLRQFVPTVDKVG